MMSTKWNKKIKAHFSKIAPTKNPRKKELYPIPDHAETLVSITTDPEAPFTQISLYHKRPKIEVKTQADYRQNLVHELYAQMLNARFDELGQSAEPPFVYAYGYYGDLLRTKDAYVTAANVSETGIVTGLKAILTENRRLMQHGFTDTELDRAKKEILKSYENRYNERNKTESGDIVEGYVYNFLTGGPQPGIEWEFAFVKNVLDGIALNEVNVLPKQWIKPENRVLVIMAPEKEGVKIPSEAEVRQLLAEVEKMETTAYEDKVISEPLMSQLPAPGQIVSEKSLDALGSTEILLSNGVKVILKPTDFKDDEVLMTAFSPGGHSLVADADYYSALSASDIITESGIRMFSYTDLQKLLTGKTVQISPYISDLAEGMSGSASPKDLETMFQLIHLYFTQPRKDETAFKSFIAKQKGFLGNLMKSPQFAFFDKQIRLMNQNHPRGGGFPQPEDFDKINLDRAFQIYQERFANAGDFTFVLVGNFDKEAIKPFLSTYLASLPTLGRQESFRDLGVRPPQGKVEESFEMGKDPKSQVMIGFAGTLKDDRERYLMQSLAEALTIKLIENLREEKGGVYGTRASASTALFPYRSYTLSVNFTCAPENVQTLMEAVYEEIAKVQKSGPTPEDLNKVKESQRKDVEKNEKENQFWLNGLRRAYYEGFEAERLTSARQLERINALTAKDLQQVAKKYLRLKTPITLVMGPEKVSQTQATPPQVLRPKRRDQYLGGCSFT
ncbi:MAG: insulinase family protein [Microscillaceae bacterium]|nr:insulinase family protein [Microscillaceae bacterium]